MNDQELLRKLSTTLNLMQRLQVSATVNNVGTLAGCMQCLQEAIDGINNRHTSTESEA